MVGSAEEQLVNLECLLYTSAYLKNLTQQCVVKEICASLDQVSVLCKCAAAGFCLQ